MRQKAAKARIILEAQDEGVIEQALDPRIAIAPGAIQPGKGLRRVIAQRIDCGDLEGSVPGIFVDQRLECRIGRTSNEGTVGLSSGVAVLIDGMPVPLDSMAGNQLDPWRDRARSNRYDERDRAQISKRSSALQPPATVHQPHQYL